MKFFDQKKLLQMETNGLWKLEISRVNKGIRIPRMSIEQRMCYGTLTLILKLRHYMLQEHAIMWRIVIITGSTIGSTISTGLLEYERFSTTKSFIDSIVDTQLIATWHKNTPWWTWNSFCNNALIQWCISSHGR